MPVKSAPRKPSLTWTRQPDGSYTDAGRQFRIVRNDGSTSWTLYCDRLNFDQLCRTLTEGKAAAEGMVARAEVQRAAESRTKKGKKAPKVKAEEPAAPPPPPPGFTITWPAAPVVEDWLVSVARVWYSLCGLYRVVRLEPKSPDVPVRFGACRKMEKGWRPVEADPHHRGAPRTFPTLQEAAEAVERYHAGTAKVAVVTKSEEMLSHATAAGLDRRPPKHLMEQPPSFVAGGGNGGENAPRLGKTGGKTPRTPKAPKAPKEPGEKGARYTLLGFPVTSVLRWMGSKGWSIAEALGALGALGLPCSPVTVATQVRDGKNGKRGAPAPLSPEQEQELLPLRAPTVLPSAGGKKPRTVAR
jgi:hypothetical protein